MADWPSAGVEPLVTIHPWSLESLGPHINAINFQDLTNIASFTAVANLCVFVPFTATKAITAVKMFSLNGNAASGHIDVGIYDVTGNKIVSSGSTTQAGTGVLQVFDITDTTFGPGQFYLAYALDNATGTLYRANGSAVFGHTLGLAEMASTFPLPATATFATFGTTGGPALVGLTTRTLV